MSPTPKSVKIAISGWTLVSYFDSVRVISGSGIIYQPLLKDPFSHNLYLNSRKIRNDKP